jgi:hypothetical protein
MIRHESTCEVTSTDSGKTVTAEVMNFRHEDGLTVVIATNKIVMKYNKKHNIYIGNALGMEFTSSGPKYYDVKQGRQR